MPDAYTLHGFYAAGSLPHAIDVLQDAAPQQMIDLSNMSSKPQGGDIFEPRRLDTPAAKESEFFLPLLLVATALALFVRIDDLSFISESLWNSDGFIYINQSRELGIRSLFVPYAGYLFTYHRIVALLASQAPLIATPYIFFCAWLAAFFSIAWVLKLRSRLAGLDEPLIVLLAVFIALQPNHGEPFFNLNHAHFFSGIALALYVCIPARKPASVPEILFLAVTSFGGPFSTLLIPVLACQLAIFRDFSRRKATYLIVTAGGLVQAMFILNSNRVHRTPMEGSVTEWLNAIESFVFFGQEDKFSCLAAALFWAITFIYLLRLIAAHRRDIATSPCLSALFASGTALIFLFSGALATGIFLPSFSPLDMVARYFVIPYSLMFYVALVSTRDHKVAQMAVVCLVSLICASGFVTVDRPDRASTTGLLPYANMQWTAFAKFQRIRPNVLIPINAPLPMYPGWGHVQIKSIDATQSAAAKSARPIPLTALPGNESTLYFDIQDRCDESSYLAVEIDIWRERMGWARISWGRPEDFDSERSLERFYPAGAMTMQFAFRRNLSDRLIRIEPAKGVAASAVTRVLKDLSRGGMVVGEPTEPGGRVGLGEVRLFCLQ